MRRQLHQDLGALEFTSPIDNLSDEGDSRRDWLRTSLNRPAPPEAKAASSRTAGPAFLRPYFLHQERRLDTKVRLYSADKLRIMPVVPAQRILVVDDEPTVCETVKMLLAFDGHSVQTARDGFEGLARFESSPFDLVITDYCMPNMKGDEFANAVKQRFPRLPVLLLTAFPPDKKPESIDLVLTKPFCFENLRDALGTLVHSTSAPEKELS